MSGLNVRILITGVAGFIGFHLAKYRLEKGDTIIGLDNLNDYYDVRLKLARLELLQKYPRFSFHKEDISDADAVERVFKTSQPQRVVNLAAQAGVRYSLTNPLLYAQSNMIGFTNIVEACRQGAVEHLVYASTSSVYGANLSQPFNEEDSANHPLTIYAASKKANELIAHSYSHLFNLPTTGLRFFTVYGPWGRPDMAFFSFTRDILAGKPINIYNNGQLQRDFTYIDDIIEGVSRAVDHIARPNPEWSGLSPDPSSSMAPYRIYNIGCGNPVNLLDYVEALEAALQKKAIKNFLPMQPGDVVSTNADTTRLESELAYKPSINYQEGIRRFVDWYLHFYQG
ncbi:NAD-dependent epimerase [Legionella quinlivanii]|uniref:NAD-dependent epimerase n=1 Tax=Legionella quinlivanii TaxID=45073 RepID=UPI00209BDFFB|nr:NAD-dependent epimerase [Legionella quinlivanii]